ncbi:hypothetical protein KM1_304150, partial [Entamoeba histolytica HM-3:IMSS]
FIILFYIFYIVSFNVLLFYCIV